MKCDKCGAAVTKSMNTCGECDAQMAGKTRGKAKAAKRTIAKKTVKHR